MRAAPVPAVIEIVEYRPEWRDAFDRHTAIIRDALRDRALVLEHVGSTSVPGLAAKPVVDILLVVQHAGDEDAYAPSLHTAGYELCIREPDWHQHRMFRTAARDVHVHVFSAGCSEIERLLGFRNRLRENAVDRQAYEGVKRRLAAREWATVDDYANAKTDTVERILADG